MESLKENSLMTSTRSFLSFPPIVIAYIRLCVLIFIEHNIEKDAITISPLHTQTTTMPEAFRRL